jgi:hypothetical protein
MRRENFDANMYDERQATETQQSPEKNEERSAIFDGGFA